jgi:hypothetical protein
MFSQQMNPHRYIAGGCLVDLTRIEFNQMLINHDNGIETRIKEMRGPS